MDTAPDSKQPTEEGVVCPKCILINAPSAAFCADCGAPIGMVSAVDPLQSILAEGFALRSAVDGPPKFIIVLGVWLIFGPVLFLWAMSLFVWSVDSESLVLTVRDALIIVGSAIILYRATRNYIVKSRAARNCED